MKHIMSVVNSTHIWLDDRGAAWVDHTNIKVIEIAVERLTHGSSSVETIVEQYRWLVSFA